MLSAVPFYYVIFALKLPETPNSTATFYLEFSLKIRYNDASEKTQQKVALDTQAWEPEFDSLHMLAVTSATTHHLSINNNKLKLFWVIN